jgi:hypothetical protein
VLERPVVYYDDVSAEVGNHLRGQALPADLYRLTGLRLERRADGVLLVDTTGWSAERFPGTGSVAQAAVLLATAIAERVSDPDGRKTRRIPVPDPAEAQEKLIGQIDAGLPSSVPLEFDADDTTADVPPEAENAERRLPLITDSFLREATAEILRRYGSAFGAAWHADPDRLRTEATELLVRFGAVLAVPGGVLARPLIGRYRSTVAQVKQRTLF